MRMVCAYSSKLFKNNLIPKKNMFVLSRNVSASYRVIATLVATAVVMWAMGAYNYAQAVSVTNLSDLLSDSAPSAPSDHTIQFVSPSGIEIGETVEITFDADFDLSGVTASDFAITAPDTNWTESIVGNVVTFTKSVGAVTPGATVTIEFDGVNKIINPAVPGSQTIDIAGTMADTGHTRVVVVDTVLVTAEVETTFEFVVTGTDEGETVNGETTTGTSTATTIPFGVIQAGPLNAKVLSQDLSVNSNSIHGFVVTVESDGQLESQTGADIDNFDEDVVGTTPVAWNSPIPTIADEKSWGHWGITSEDATTTRASEFGSNTWLGVTTTPTIIYSHNGPADGTTEGIGATTVGYKLEITALQEAADDYTATLTYIATPTF